MPPAGLAARTVVRLVLRVADPLDRRAADRARLAVAAMHGHPVAKRGDSLGKSARRPRCRSRSVQSSSTARVAANRRRTLGSERARQRQWREPRAMQDLVGVGVADAAQEPRVGERALEGVVRRVSRAANAAKSSPRPRDRRGRARRAPPRRDDVQRRPPLLPASVSVSVPFSNSNVARTGRLRRIAPAGTSAAGRRS